MELNKKKITEMIELRLVRQNSNSCTVSCCKSGEVLSCECPSNSELKVLLCTVWWQ